MTVAAIKISESVIRWHYLPWALLAIAVMVAAIVADNLWFLDYVHVFSSLLWTGIDLFMGFVLGPILRRLDLPARREIMRRLTPRTLFLMPTVSIISGTSGWFLAVKLGYTGLEWPAYGWVAAALILVTLMTIQGLGFLTSTQQPVAKVGARVWFFARPVLEIPSFRPQIGSVGCTPKSGHWNSAAKCLGSFVAEGN